MRNVKYIAVHCTAGPQSQTVQAILNYWKNVKGWSKPGYHHLIEPNGKINDLLPIAEISNGVQGFNSQTINIAYIGGINTRGKAADNRTEQQNKSLIQLLKNILRCFLTQSYKGIGISSGSTKIARASMLKSWIKNIDLDEETDTELYDKILKSLPDTVYDLSNGDERTKLATLIYSSIK